MTRSRRLPASTPGDTSLDKPVGVAGDVIPRFYRGMGGDQVT